MNNPYRTLAADYARLLAEGKTWPLGGFRPAVRPAAANAPAALLFSPHPDDECIVGALPLRLLRERGMRIVNVAVTQGSRQARRAARWDELCHACAYLGFETIPTRDGGLEKISVAGRAQQPDLWAPAVATLARLLQHYRPRIVFCPHEHDWNSTHIGTHFLVLDALRALPSDFTCRVCATEFWAPMADPNLMIESSVDDVGDLVTALSFHVGEVQRNPYHLRLPAWMLDNVRRGGELVGGQGGAAPDFAYATLYRLHTWTAGALQPADRPGRMLSASECLSGLCD